MIQFKNSMAGVIAMMICLAFLFWQMPGLAAMFAIVGGGFFAYAFYQRKDFQ